MNNNKTENKTAKCDCENYQGSTCAKCCPRPTPGPWEFSQQGYIVEANNRGTIVACINSVKRNADDDMTKWGSEGEANAALIAAAPELLAACKDALYIMAQFKIADTATIRAAIAKAEGR